MAGTPIDDASLESLWPVWLASQSRDVQSRIWPEASGHILDPVQPFGSPADPVALCICCLVRSGGRNILLLPGIGSGALQESVGRTSIVLEMLGIDLPYSRFVGRDLLELTEPMMPRLRQAVQARPELIVIDRAYVAIVNQTISVIPIRGELLDFGWDVARHFYRSIRVGYSPGMHRDARYRPELARLFANLRLTVEVLECYSVSRYAGCTVDEIVVIEPAEQASDEVFLMEAPLDERVRTLALGIEFSAAHPSTAWQSRRQATLDFLRQVEQLPAMAGPRVWVLRVKQRLTCSHVFMRSVAETLSSTPTTWRVPKFHRGGGYRNAVVMEALRAGSSVTVLAISAAALVGDRLFWLAVGAGSGTTLVLSSPEASPARDIEDAIGAIRRMRDLLAIPRERLRFGIYEGVPEFQGALVGAGRLILGYPPAENRTQESILFQMVTESDPLFEDFHEHLNTVLARVCWK